jgi:hypothetical protein
MPYVKRDREGRVVAVSLEAAPGQEEELPLDDSELIQFYGRGLKPDSPLSFLLRSDLDLTRVLEDLIDLLVMRGVINFTDLPESAQSKLLGRRMARADLKVGDKGGLLVEDEVLRL